MSDEIKAPELAEVPTAAENQDSQIVCLECYPKDGTAVPVDMKTGKPLTMEIAKAGEPYYVLQAGQFAKMTRGRANWHVERSMANDASNRLTLRVVTLEEMQTRQEEKRKEKAAQASADAQAKKDADKAAADAKAASDAAAKVRLELVDKAVKAGAIKDATEADSLTNDDLAAKVKDAQAKK